jgi:sorting nexin-4
MLGDEDDVFDSVTWETPAAHHQHDAGGPSVPSGPGFRQSTADGDSEHGPHDPKWEGYLITAVKDPVKELAETKDTYVSYLVTAKVWAILITIGSSDPDLLWSYAIDKSADILNTEPILA